MFLLCSSWVLLIAPEKAFRQMGELHLLQSMRKNGGVAPLAQKNAKTEIQLSRFC
jgi:hypothetical protein